MRVFIKKERYHYIHLQEKKSMFFFFFFSKMIFYRFIFYRYTLSIATKAYVPNSIDAPVSFSM